ncbi:protein kinase domain-containing protein [Saccharomonospora cyanea]|uniref:non-specific serine/threonine protein kinase n=1 Tax=Saccharomonospora cyanea NA-134 TaxID=882082 RepID=H5XLX1_9PSEU|nr:protein kinase [Saccharomonospora cyanea]EHR62013.1 protein kinase family protein [Saccharomonospora cyanea NA-134]
MTTGDDADELVLVGRGPVATVYAGVRDDAGFALKVYPGVLDRRTLRAVRTELSTLASLRGHAPVLVADSVESLPGGRTGLRMELCAQSLAEFVEGAGRRPAEETLTMGEALVEALAAAHGRGVVHGGVSPGNVLFQGSGATLLSDFGTTLRRRFAPDTSPHETAAPETLRDGSLDERSDLYGLGATLYFALTGRSPHPRYRGEPDDAYVLRVLSEPVAAIDRPDVPPALADLVLRLLAKNPADRPGNAAEVGARLRAVRAGAERPAPPLLPDLGEPILVSGPARRRRRRRLGPGPVVVGLMAVAMLVVGAVLLLAYRPQDVAVSPAPAEIRGPATPSPPPARTPHVELAEPLDHGHYVELSWHSEARLHYAVLIAVEGGGLDTVYVRDRTSHRVEVDPALGYCFRVHGTDGARVYTSEVRSLRDATCSL